MKKENKNWLDFAALLVALGVDLSLNIVAMLIISPPGIQLVGFVAIAFLVVIFGVRAWVKNHKILWAIFAFVALFLDTSFVLASTQTRDEAIAITRESLEDTELVRLSGEVERYQARIDDLQGQFNRAMQRDTMDSLQDQIILANNNLSEARSNYNQRLNLVESGELANRITQISTNTSSKEIFNAIPNAWNQGRWIELCLMLLIFTGLQLTIVAAAQKEIIEDKKEEAQEPKKENPKVNKALIRGNFGVLDNPIIIKKHLTDFIDRYFDLGKIPSQETISIDKDVYSQIMQVFFRCGITTKDGEIKETKERAIKIIEELRLKNYV